MNSPVFILSTGRTGTKFFEAYFNQTPGEAICRHEPRPSRRFKFLSNLYLNQKVDDALIIKTFQLSRRRTSKKLGNKVYIESSNFIFGCIPSLNKRFDNIKVIHIVRHPVSYVKSHLNKGFWRGHKRFFAKYVPYWLEKMDVTGKAGPIKLLSARWNYVNSQIRSYSGSNQYLLVRFEDLFSSDEKLSSDKLNEIRQFCCLKELDEAENIKWLRKPKNYSRRKQVLEPSEVDNILKDTEPLMKEYLYHE